MDTTFLSCVLVVLLLILFSLYIIQLQNKINPIRLKDNFLPVIWDTCTNKRLSSSKNLPKGVYYDGMPVHRIGPVMNFHQHFKPCLPELGWRNYYLNNYNDYQVPTNTNFDSCIIRNYLNNLENVDNIYRKCD